MTLHLMLKQFMIPLHSLVTPFNDIKGNLSLSKPRKELKTSFEEINFVKNIFTMMINIQ